MPGVFPSVSDSDTFWVPLLGQLPSGYLVAYHPSESDVYAEAPFGGSTVSVHVGASLIHLNTNLSVIRGLRFVAGHVLVATGDSSLIAWPFVDRSFNSETKIALPRAVTSMQCASASEPHILLQLDSMLLYMNILTQQLQVISVPRSLIHMTAQLGAYCIFPGGHLIAASRGRDLYFIGPAPEESHLSFQSPVTALAPSPDGRALAVALAGLAEVIIVQLNTLVPGSLPRFSVHIPVYIARNGKPAGGFPLRLSWGSELFASCVSFLSEASVEPGVPVVHDRGISVCHPSEKNAVTSSSVVSISVSERSATAAVTGLYFDISGSAFGVADISAGSRGLCAAGWRDGGQLIGKGAENFSG